MSMGEGVTRKALFLDSAKDSGLYRSYSPSKQNNAPKIGTLLIVVVAFAILFKYSYLLTGKSAGMIFNEASTEAIVRAKTSSAWLQSNYGSLSIPLLCGLLVTLFTWIIVYLDSDVPGQNPPSPFSPQKNSRRRVSLHKEKTCHLSYLISAASGITVFFLLFLSN